MPAGTKKRKISLGLPTTDYVCVSRKGRGKNATDKCVAMSKSSKNFHSTCGATDVERFQCHGSQIMRELSTLLRNPKGVDGPTLLAIQGGGGVLPPPPCARPAMAAEAHVQ